jgi:hypothetical protein
MQYLGSEDDSTFIWKNIPKYPKQIWRGVIKKRICSVR